MGILWDRAVCKDVKEFVELVGQVLAEMKDGKEIWQVVLEKTEEGIYIIEIC